MFKKKWQTFAQLRVTNTQIPIHGTLRVDKKDNEAIKVLGLNKNSMLFWLKDNYKAERLKFIFEKYDINTTGLQEVCINWTTFKPSQTIASLPHTNAEMIRSIASITSKSQKILEDPKGEGQLQVQETNSRHS